MAIKLLNNATGEGEVSMLLYSSCYLFQEQAIGRQTQGIQTLRTIQ